MTYVRILNNQIVEYPVYEGDIRLRYPNVSFPTNNFQPPEEYVKVEDTTPPPSTHFENVSESLPVQTPTGWKRNWVVEPASGEEIQQRIDNQWVSIRSQRNNLLQKSDWVVTKAIDTETPVSDEWKQYRQALRDITLQDDPFNITWPIEVGDRLPRFIDSSESVGEPDLNAPE